MLALAESDYGKPPEGAKVISMSTWAQYVLDNHATVAEAVADLRKEKFRVQTVVLPTGRPANMHLAISDSSGDSAIFEYINGNLVIHHGKQYKVLTNSPDLRSAIGHHGVLEGRRWTVEVLAGHFARCGPFCSGELFGCRNPGRDVPKVH